MTEPTIGTIDDPIQRRALAFARTFRLVNPRIKDIGPASPEIVGRFGTSDAAEYGEVRIEMDWSKGDKSEFLADCDPAQRSELQGFLDPPQELLVVCSGNDVIYHDFPNTDLD